MKENVIITFGQGGWYPKGVDRMREKLSKFPQNWDFQGWKNQLPPGSPPHSEIPYGFKAYALKWAFDKGYKRALWMDTSVIPNKNPEAKFKQIKDTGYLVLRNGWSNAVWSTDAQLKYYGFTRDEAEKVKHPMATIMGMDFTHPLGKKLYDMFLQAAKDKMFCGPWWNKNYEVSRDPRVLGSRHDQTCLGFIAYKLGLEHTEHQASYKPEGDFFFYVVPVTQ